MAFNSFKYEQDKNLLHTISEAVFVLKLHAQGNLEENGFQLAEAEKKRQDLSELLHKLEKTVTALQEEIDDTVLDITFIGLANKFIQINPADVPDRKNEIQHLAAKLKANAELLPRDFQLLDNLQGHLEAEVLAAFNDLYRL